MPTMQEALENPNVEKPMSIYEKINMIMQEVQFLQKDDNVEFKTTKYKALSEEKATSTMRKMLIKYRLIVYPVEQTWSREGNITHVDVKYHMVNIDDPRDSIIICSCGDGADTQDKGSGKAMTYAFKYMWLRTFALPTGEDPDKISSDQLDAEAAEMISEEEIAVLENMLSENQIQWAYKAYKIKGLEQMTKEQFGDLMKRLAAQEEEKKAKEKKSGDEGKDN